MIDESDDRSMAMKWKQKGIYRYCLCRQIFNQAGRMQEITLGKIINNYENLWRYFYKARI